LAAVRADPNQFDLALTNYNMPGGSDLYEVAKSQAQSKRTYK